MVIHWPIVSGPLVKHSTGRAAIWTASTAEEQGAVATLVVAVALPIAALQGTEVEAQIVVETRLESVLPVEMQLARAIDLAPREVAAVSVAENELAVAMSEAVPGAGAPSEVPDTAAAVSAQVAAGVLQAWMVRVGALAEVAAEVSVAAVVAVAVVAAVAVAAAVAAVVVVGKNRMRLSALASLRVSRSPTPVDSVAVR